MITDEFASAGRIPDQDISYPEYLETWRSVALGGLTVHRVPGTHLTMLAGDLAGGVADVIERCEPRRTR